MDLKATEKACSSERCKVLLMPGISYVARELHHQSHAERQWQRTGPVRTHAWKAAEVPSSARGACARHGCHSKRKLAGCPSMKLNLEVAGARPQACAVLPLPPRQQYPWMTCCQLQMQPKGGKPGKCLQQCYSQLTCVEIPGPVRVRVSTHDRSSTVSP